jgi:hypothetical protein
METMVLQEQPVLKVRLVQQDRRDQLVRPALKAQRAIPERTVRMELTVRPVQQDRKARRVTPD